jgi:hypothetical protein
LPLIRAVVLGPRQAGPRLHVQVLGGHVTRTDGGERVQEGTSLGWQLFELAASYPPGDATVALVGRLVWPELDLTEEQVARRIYNHVHDLQAVWVPYLGPERAREVLRARGVARSCWIPTWSRSTCTSSWRRLRPRRAPGQLLPIRPAGRNWPPRRSGPCSAQGAVYRAVAGRP